MKSIKKASLVFDKVEEVHEEPDFVDWLRAGWQVSFTVAIDYTQSNKPIDQPDSLHKVASGFQN